MLHLGAHMSTGKGFDRAARDARVIGADAMQVFTRNPRGGKARVLRENELAQLAQEWEQGLVIVCHAPYTVNLASALDDVRAFGQQIIAEDLQRMQKLGARALVVHSGAHTGAGEETGLARLIQSLELLLPSVPDGSRISTTAPPSGSVSTPVICSPPAMTCATGAPSKPSLPPRSPGKPSAAFI